MKIRISLICLIAFAKNIRQISDIRIRFVGADIDAAIGLGLILVMDAGAGDWFGVDNCDGCEVGDWFGGDDCDGCEVGDWFVVDACDGCGVGRQVCG